MSPALGLVGEWGAGGTLTHQCPHGVGATAIVLGVGWSWGTGALWAPERQGGGRMEAWQLREERRAEQEQGKPPGEGVV